MFPPSKPNDTAIDRPVNEDDGQWLLHQLQATGQPVGFTWLLSPERAADKLYIHTIDNISNNFVNSPN